jgi:hypothetical protein
MTFQPGKIKYDEVAGNLSFCLDIRLEYLKKAKKRSLGTAKTRIWYLPNNSQVCYR